MQLCQMLCRFVAFVSLCFYCVCFISVCRARVHLLLPHETVKQNKQAVNNKTASSSETTESSSEDAVLQEEVQRRCDGTASNWLMRHSVVQLRLLLLLLLRPIHRQRSATHCGIRLPARSLYDQSFHFVPRTIHHTNRLCIGRRSYIVSLSRTRASP